MSWPLTETRTAHLAFTGDVFESEDQRNWGDASYKTYCTPLSLPFPVTITRGDKIRQSVTLSLQGQLKAEAAITSDERESIRIGLASDPPVIFPQIGVCKSSLSARLSPDEIALLQQVGFSHYRVDLHIDQSDWSTHFEDALLEANALRIPLHVVLFLTRNWIEDIAHFIAVCMNSKPDIRAITLLSADALVPPEDLIDKVIPPFRRAFPDTKIGSGTDAFFTQLNRARPSAEQIDFLTFSSNPQVHASGVRPNATV